MPLADSNAPIASTFYAVFTSSYDGYVAIRLADAGRT